MKHASARMLRAWRRLTLVDVLVLTVPPLALVFFLLGAACLDFYRASQYSDWWSRSATSVKDMLRRRVEAAVRSPRASRIHARLSAEDEHRTVLRLHVDRNQWEAMTSDVPAHWGEWIDATIEDGADFLPAEIRLRGDASGHWITAKKSLAIKLRRGRTFRGWRRFNLTVKGVIGQDVIASTASRMDLLTPLSGVVPVYVNGGFQGLYRLLGRPDESFLRASDRMPGSVFRGETLLRGDTFKNVRNELFANPYVWDRTAENDPPGGPVESHPIEWIAALNGSTFAEHERLMDWFDRAELSRFLALQLLWGDPHHMGNRHNQFWYEDPSSGTMHPIVWDLSMRRLAFPRPRVAINRLWGTVLRDPRVFDGTLRFLTDWLEEDRFFELALQLADSAQAAHPVAFDYDYRRYGMIVPLSSRGTVRRRVRSNVDLLNGWLRDARVAFHASRVPGRTQLVDLVVSGRSAVSLGGLLLRPPEGDRVSGGEVRLRADTNLNGEPDAADRELDVSTTVEGTTVRVHLSEAELLLPGCRADRAVLVPEPLLYRFFLDVLDPSGERVTPSSVEPVLHGRFGDGVELTEVHEGGVVGAARSWHPWQYERSAPEPLRWEGEVHLRSSVEIDAGSVLVIAPGTRIRLDPDVSVLVRGRVTARGTEAYPITVEPADASLPWGAFALQGEGANGSRLEHVRFRGGGGGRVGRVEYKGSVSVHKVDDVVFADCHFASNLRCDDLLNVVLSDVDLVSCDFRDANADAVDYDLSTGEISRCRITDCGNDGIDLMSCAPRILSTRIARCGDKGISIGEDAAPLVFGCEVTECAIGLEVKDLSTPLVLDTSVTGNDLGLLQRRKSGYFAAGGRAAVVGTLVADNGVDYRGLDAATLTRCHSRIGASSDGEGDREDAVWLRAVHGLAVDAAGPGRPAGWRVMTPAETLAEGVFRDDFGDPTSGWRRLGSVRRLMVRDRVLTASFDRGAGAVGTPVDWRVPRDEPHVLIVEASGASLAPGAIALRRDEGDVEGPLRVDDDPAIARYSVLELPPGRYRGMVLSGEAHDRAGALRVHGWRVLALSRDGHPAPPEPRR